MTKARSVHYPTAIILGTALSLSLSYSKVELDGANKTTAL